MSKQTNVKFDKHGWEINHKYDETLIEKMCYYDRLYGDNGFSEDRTHRTIAKIPRHRLFSDIELILYQKYQGKDDKLAKEYFDRWIYKHPQFKTCTGGI